MSPPLVALWPIACVLISTIALAGELVRDERRLWSDGSPRLVLSARDGSLLAMDASDKAGTHWVLDDRGWRGPEGLLERCRLWGFDPGAPRPGR